MTPRANVRFARGGASNFGLPGFRKPQPWPEALADADLRADVFELLPDRLGLFLGHAFLDRLRRALDEVLGFLQTQAGDFADDLDDLDLVAAGFRQRDVELGLFFDRGRCRGAAARTRGRHGHRGRRAHAEFGFERLHELRELEDADALDVVDHLLLIQFCHFVSPDAVASGSRLWALGAGLSKIYETPPKSLTRPPLASSPPRSAPSPDCAVLPPAPTRTAASGPGGRRAAWRRVPASRAGWPAR